VDEQLPGRGSGGRHGAIDAPKVGAAARPPLGLPRKSTRPRGRFSPCCASRRQCAASRAQRLRPPDLPNRTESVLLSIRQGIGASTVGMDPNALLLSPERSSRGLGRPQCSYPCNSGAPAVISRALVALLLSCARASVAEFRRQTLAPDDTQSSGPVPTARLLSAEGASVFAQRMGEPPSKTRRIERTELASDAAGLADAQTPCTRETR
jgi:hypothetical protein